MEELLAAAHAAAFSMSLANELERSELLELGILRRRRLRSCQEEGHCNERDSSQRRLPWGVHVLFLDVDDGYSRIQFRTRYAL